MLGFAGSVGASILTKQVALDRISGEGCAVDAHERPVAARAQVVNAMGEHRLAGADFAKQQDARIARRHLPHLLEHAANARAVADDGRRADQGIQLLT